MIPPDPALVESPDEILDRLDALVLAGGADIDPASYGAAPHPETLGTVPARDEAELALVIGRDAAEVGRLGPALAVLLLATAPIAWLWVEVNLTSLAVATLLVVAVLGLRRELGGEQIEQAQGAVGATRPAASPT